MLLVSKGIDVSRKTGRRGSIDTCYMVVDSDLTTMVSYCAVLWRLGRIGGSVQAWRHFERFASKGEPDREGPALVAGQGFRCGYRRTLGESPQ